MRIIMPVAVALVTFGMTSPATATEFQPIGTLGMGGAGVARPPDGLAPYWNPAALAFNTTAYAAKLHAGAGLTLNNNLADNLDRLADINVDALQTFSTTAAANTAKVGELVKAVGILQDINREEGAVTARASAVFGNHIGHLGLGAYGSVEAASLPRVDLANVRPKGASGAPLSPSDFAAAAAGSPSSTSFFDGGQRTAIQTALAANGFTAAQATDIVNLADAQLAVSSAGVSSAEATDAFLALASAFGSPGTLDQNASVLRNRGLRFVEFPLSYGHPVDLGPFGTLGLGASAKLILGRVYVSEVRIFNVDSGEIIDEIRNTFEDSTTWGVDVGALWKLRNWLSLGVVAKHLNTPTFRAPAGPDFALKPQVRTGVAWDPFSWLTLAADLDLTENATALAGHESRTLGGGLEVHPFTWLKLRGGAYKNLAENDIGTVVTAGLTLGIKWVNFDVDAASALDTAKFNGQDYPKEARVQANLNVRF